MLGLSITNLLSPPPSFIFLIRFVHLASLKQKRQNEVELPVKAIRTETSRQLSLDSFQLVFLSIDLLIELSIYKLLVCS